MGVKFRSGPRSITSLMNTSSRSVQRNPNIYSWEIFAVGGIFLLSGATALVYQVAWMRMLSLFFGSDVYAAAITLSVFMGGLSVGSWLAGRFGDQFNRPLVIYGFLEIGIAAYALVFPILLASFEITYQSIYRESFEALPWLYQGARFLVAALTMLIPAMLMGATLPIIIRQFAVRAPELGKHVGFFYSVNTVGALLGTVVGGFVLIPILGVKGSVLVALIINFIIGLAAIGIAFRSRSRFKPLESRPRPVISVSQSKKRQAVLLAIAISGMAALALEVVWMRILVQSFSSTVYAFSIMLSCFLFGIFFGSYKVSGIIDQHNNPVRLFATLECWLAGTIALLGVLTFVVPFVFGTLVWGLTDVTGGAFGVSSIIAQFIVASILIVGPTIMLGATFPVAVKIYTHDIEERAFGTGSIYAANTAGAVIGAVLGGFILLPLFGARGSLIIIAGCFAIAGIVLIRSEGRDQLRRILFDPIFSLAIGLLVISTVVVFLLPDQTVLNFNQQQSAQPDVIYHGEGVSHTVDLIRSDNGNTIMMINGNIEADTTLLQRRHFILKGHLPLLLHPDPADIAIVGLGLGITLGASERHPTVKNIRLVELSPHIVEAHKYITDVTGDILASPKINLRIDDGRNFMAMTDESFDMITADPIHPRITGVGYLYTKEYYEQIRKRLRPGGIVTQWMPMYRVSKDSFDVAFRTFVSVFPNASFWYVRGHGLFVATIDDFKVDYKTLSDRFDDPAVRADMESIGIYSTEQFLGHLLMDAEHIQKYLVRYDSDKINTDDNAYLEYRTPFEFTEKTENIVTDLVPFAGWDIDRLMPDSPVSVQRKVQKYFEDRRGKLISELSEPIE